MQVRTGGARQLKVLAALFEDDCLSGRVRTSYLQDSASIIRGCFPEHALATRTDRTTDRDLCFLLDSTGPTFFYNGGEDNRRDVRRVGNVYYTRGFANLFLEFALTEHGRLRPIRDRLVQVCVRGHNPLWHLFPRHPKTTAAVLEDIMASPYAQGTKERLITQCCEHSEFTHMSIDATVRIAMSLKGQANYRASRAKKEAAALPEEEAKRSVLTARGRTGAVLGMWLIRSEATNHVSDALAGHFPQDYRQQVVAIFSDDPSNLMFATLRRVFSELTFLCLDSVHLVIVYLQAHYRKRTAGSQYLRIIMHKLNKVDTSFNALRKR